MDRFIGTGRSLLRKVLGIPGQKSEGFPEPVLGYDSGVQGEIRGRALLTYLAVPFRMETSNLLYPTHSNLLQSVEIANALNRLGYKVDIVDWLDADFAPSADYEVFVGMHTNFERLASYLDANIPKVYYATGAYWEFEIEAQKSRIEKLNRRRSVDYRIPIRLGRNEWVQLADAVIHKGNEFVAAQYRSHNSNVHSVNNFTLPLARPLPSHRDIYQTTKNFLWFEGTGLLHKGLDLVLEAFCELPDYHLWVCGPLDTTSEKEFLAIYRTELFHQHNIHPMGWINVYSRDFEFLTDKCGFQVSVSCSEAGAGSVLNCMGRGVVPVLHQNVGIDIDGIGISIEQDSVSSIKEAVLQAANTSKKEYMSFSQKAYQQSIGKYSIESFGTNIENTLSAIIAAGQAAHQ